MSVGLDYYTYLVYKDGENDIGTNLGSFVDAQLANNPTAIETVDAATEKLTLENPDVQIFFTDQNGVINLHQVTAVYRVKLADLATYQLLKLKTQSAVYLTLLSATPFCTRIDNVIQGKSADQLVEGDYVCQTLIGYTLETTGPRQVQYSPSNYTSIPGIITQTWGELILTRGNCLDLVSIIQSYPDQVDQSDLDVVNEVIGENTKYDPIIEISDETLSYTQTYPNRLYMYWIETDGGGFQIHDTSICFGNPLPGQVYAPLSRLTSKDSLPKASKPKTFDEIKMNVTYS